jgi:hypothetical protein
LRVEKLGAARRGQGSFVALRMTLQKHIENVYTATLSSRVAYNVLIVDSHQPAGGKLKSVAG